jgi:PQQ enzyme repeat
VDLEDLAVAVLEEVPEDHHPAVSTRCCSSRGGGYWAPRVSTGFSVSEVTPLVIHGVMYITTPSGRVTALDPTTGKEIWSYKLPSGEPATRGVEYFPGDKQTPPLIVVGTSDAKLFTLDSKTGVFNKAFGVDGIVDLNTPEITHDLPNASDGLSSPPIMYNNLIILGGRTTESGGQPFCCMKLLLRLLPQRLARSHNPVQRAASEAVDDRVYPLLPS